MKRNDYVSKKYLRNLKKERMNDFKFANNLEIKRQIFNDIKLINKLLKINEEE
jgi:hypothetical protein